MQNSVPEIPVIRRGVCALSHMSKLRTLLSGSTRNETKKPTQSLKRTLIKVGGSSQYGFQLLTVISKMQSVLEFNDVRPVRIARLDGRYDTQTSRMWRAPSPSYADSVSSSYVDWSAAFIEHVHSIAFHIIVLSRPDEAIAAHACTRNANLIALSDAVFDPRPM